MKKKICGFCNQKKTKNITGLCKKCRLIVVEAYQRMFTRAETRSDKDAAQLCHDNFLRNNPQYNGTVPKPGVDYTPPKPAWPKCKLMYEWESVGREASF